ncbi:hypothetical protein CDD83_4929 [Cordyceps sp. RAO-2017]|nr:hypothetical protein CDD83_4929 [Cordyceps sp. RAO-2017]
MLRQPVAVAARGAARRPSASARPVSAGLGPRCPARLSSASAAKDQRRPRVAFRPWWGVALLCAGAAGGYWARPSAAVIRQVPGIPDAASEDEVPVASPVRVLDLEAANRKIREEAHSFVFASGDGHDGRVDVVRVSSNSPVEDEWALAYGKGLGGGQALYAGVYDGHAGWATSSVLKKTLVRYVSGALSRLPRSSDGEAVAKTIQDAFERLDARIMDDARRAVKESGEHGAGHVIAALAPAIAGSCALLSIYDASSSTLRTAVTGDSRAVLGSRTAGPAGGYSAVELSKDQTGFNADEVRRLDAEHPDEMGNMIDSGSGRLMGIAITRAFGDHRWKWSGDDIRAAQSGFFAFPPRPHYKTPPYMTARPEVTTRRVAADDFVILASDGLWDVMSNQDAVACVHRWLEARRTGKPEAVTPAPSVFTAAADGYACWKATPESFAIEDLDNAAVCLVKNALGGRRRTMFCGAMTAYAPLSRYVRDDITVQVIFFRNPPDGAG